MLRGPFPSADHSAGQRTPDRAGTQMACRVAQTLGAGRSLTDWDLSDVRLRLSLCSRHCLSDLSGVHEPRWWKAMFWDLIELHYCWLFFSNTWCWPSSHHVAFLTSTVFLISLIFSKIIFAIRFLKGYPKFSGLCIVLGVIFWSEPRHYTSQTICEQRNGQCSKILSICWNIKKCNLDYAFRNNMRKTKGTILASQWCGKNLRIHLWKFRMMKESGLGWTLQSTSLSVLRCTGHSTKPLHQWEVSRRGLQPLNVRKDLYAVRDWKNIWYLKLFYVGNN